MRRSSAAAVPSSRQMLAAADDVFDPTLPGLFAGDPPAEFVALMEEMAADVRPGSMGSASRSVEVATTLPGSRLWTTAW